jgi:crotonobetainyl-CoA:carnitine CoA-transferase CaiB-like acyl-CoA transferase
MVPAAGVLLADFGADVIKVEHPKRGDPARGLVTGGQTPSAGSVNLMVEQTNRGKRSIGLDISTDAGRRALYDLVASADVVLTSFLPAARRKLLVDEDHLRERKPDLIYVRADAVGPDGPEHGKPGYDAGVFFGRAGILNSFTRTGQPLAAPRPGFGDKTSSLSIAYGVASALYQRERTGEGTSIDVSLFGTAMWVASSDIVYSGVVGGDFSRLERPATNPVAYHYQTKDGRWIMLQMLESTRWWPDFCRHLGREDLISNPLYADAKSRSDNSEACVRELAEVFASASLAEWRERFATLRAPWEIVQDSYEVLSDQQATSNGFVAEVAHPSGENFRVVRSPVRFNGTQPEIQPAPEVGQHTEEVLLEIGYSWEDIGGLHEAGALP